MKITTIGIDLAKEKFQLHAVNADGKVMLKKQLSRNKVLEFLANTPPCLGGWRHAEALIIGGVSWNPRFFRRN